MSTKDAPAATTQAWPADKVERLSVESLIPYARNARTHSEAQVAQIAASIREWGWTTPVLVDEGGNLIAGHGRVLAARLLGIVDIPAMTARGWSEGQKRAYILADNKLAMNAGWDEELLRVELDDLLNDGFNVDLTGFSPDEMIDLAIDVNAAEDLEPLIPANSGESKTLKMSFGKKTVPLTEGEYEALLKSLDEYVVEYGMTSGWIGRLFDV